MDANGVVVVVVMSWRFDDFEATVYIGYFLVVESCFISFSVLGGIYGIIH